MEKKTILIIVDNSEERENISALLELNGYKVISATNGKDGVSAAQQHHPDLIICDLIMPLLDGYGVIHLLGKNIDTARIPFIFLSSRSDHSELKGGLELRSDDCITMPFSKTEMLKSVESRLKKALTNEGSIDHFNHRLKQGKARSFDWIEALSELPGKQTRTLVKKEVVFSEGDTCQNLYVVLKGKVKLFKSHDLGKDLILRVRGKGDIFAFSSLFQGDIHLDSAEALEPAELLMIPKTSFFDWLEGNPKMLLEMIQLFSNALELERERAVQLAYSSVRKRTANALYRLKLRFHNESDSRFTVSISRDDLAAMVGTATESVIRTLSDFKEEGLIAIQGSHITILQEEKLRRMKN